jgi:hypothetical protein
MLAGCFGLGGAVLAPEYYYGSISDDILAAVRTWTRRSLGFNSTSYIVVVP